MWQTQERLIGEPIVQHLQGEFGPDGAEQRLLALLEGWRGRLQQVHQAGVEGQDASVAGAHLAEAVLAEAFNFPVCVALSRDGASLMARTSMGEVLEIPEELLKHLSPLGWERILLTGEYRWT